MKFFIFFFQCNITLFGHSSSIIPPTAQSLGFFRILNTEKTVVVSIGHYLKPPIENRKFHWILFCASVKIRMECKHFDVCEYKNMTVYKAIHLFYCQMNALCLSPLNFWREKKAGDKITICPLSHPPLVFCSSLIKTVGYTPNLQVAPFTIL